ncbi:branched-chain amino acid aminotransferase [Roseomonas sp. SSH11]|uniref:Branched-chain-amino-acid aminotransferase n=1 Tax=Pararoseomonas baculiformis TaxID=2820812 RepID=A0ABS4AJM3_9PROT|nr:branched-chain amino acid aminotransferase [Pararoseomonas baculiformis]MBP0447086.1 branched-chain amino acid aminotransferase [Pararoseomonas baculiformis]
MALPSFDDRDGWIWFDGQFVPWRDAKLHVLTHGLHYASGVFEGERAYAGNIFKLREHTERLFESARILGFRIPYTVEEIDAACIEVMQRNGLTEGYIRPIAYRGSEMLAVAAQNTSTHVAIAAWPWPNLFGEDRMKGITLGMAPWRRPAPDTAPTASKATGLYMIGTMSKHAAEAEGFNDALMLDWKGDVAEATGANAFFVFDGEVHTPTPIGFLDGITRRTVMNLARQNQMKVVERTIAADEIGRATEVFLAGTAAEVTPVRRIAGHHYTPGQITETLVAEYSRLVRMSPEEVLRRAA